MTRVVICLAAAAFALPPENTIAYSGFLRDYDGNIVGVPNGAPLGAPLSAMTRLYRPRVTALAW